VRRIADAMPAGSGDDRPPHEQEGAVMSGMGTTLRLVGCVATLTLIGCGLAGTAVSADVVPITYRTYFQDPGPAGAQDLSLENHAISLIEATPPGAQITFAFRDFNRSTVADALIRAHQRGVVVDGVIDGGERTRAVVRNLVAAIGPSRVVLCGTPSFTYNSCISDALVGTDSLMHNKFLTFSALSDGRQHVVLQTSKNFLSPSQLSYYNDMVEITGDVPLYDTYVSYLFDLKAQRRTSDYYHLAEPLAGDNTVFFSPRAQPDPETGDTIVEQMDEIDCSGAGQIRVAQLAFRTERAAIMHKLIELEHEGCDIEIIVSNVDGDIMAGLAAAGIPVHPYILRNAGTRPQVLVHDKFWLVDARSTRLGTRARITYAGSSNWRFDEQRSDDLLLRIRDDDVFTAYSEYWNTIRTRVDGDDPPWASTDTSPPSSAVDAEPAPNQAGWNTSAVKVRVAGSDGHASPAAFSGLQALRVELSGADPGPCEATSASRSLAVRECTITADGTTTITYGTADLAGNVEASRSLVVRVDRTPPDVACSVSPSTLWPPNHKLVTVGAHVAVTDATSGPAGFELVAVSSSEPESGTDPDDLAGDIVGWTPGTSDASGQLRAERSGAGSGRIYTLTFAGRDRAGNQATCSDTVQVPHDMGR
jgi:phospholipase D-like protein